VNEHDLAGAENTPVNEGEMCGQVVQGQSRPTAGVDVVREWKDHRCVDSGRLGEASGDRQRCHAVTGTESGTVRADRSGHLPAGDERQFGTRLVLPASLQEVREDHARPLDVDEDLAFLGLRLRKLSYDQGIGPLERGDDDTLHQYLPVPRTTSRPPCACTTANRIGRVRGYRMEEPMEIPPSTSRTMPVM
jgi:hypothetical protein